MSGSSQTVGNLGWSRCETLRLMDALPLIDEPLNNEPDSVALHRLHWISAAVALTLLVLARLDLLPPMPW